jgi:hypothetical protein
MKKSTQFILTVLLCLCHSLFCNAQSADSVFLISIPDSTIIDHIGSNSIPVFKCAGVNSILENYTISSFKREAPTSRFSYMRQYWRVSCNSMALGTALKAAYPTFFPVVEKLGMPRALSRYTPNDDGTIYDTSWLNMIHVMDAWGIPNCPGCKGDSNVIIGITDTWFDTHNKDLIHKIVQSNVSITPGSGHGTQVAGIAAGETDNATYFPSVGFKCRLDVKGPALGDNAEMLAMSQRTGRRVLNGSWHYGNPTNTLDLASNFISQGVFNDIYENGVVACIAAGNGWSDYCGGPNAFTYPASLDHVISTTGVMHWVDTFTATTIGLQYVHDYDVSDTSGSSQNNVRVDLMAPYTGISSAGSDPNDTSVHINAGGWGTSFASPMTAGGVALMFSAKPCLSPYQIEYILKTQSDDVYGVSWNKKYAGPTRYTGRIGAGILNLNAAITYAISPGRCNDPATQTFYIAGIEVNTVCAPGFASNSATPTLKPILVNGTPPYVYKWEPINNNNPLGNNTTLSAYNVANPTIISSTGNRLAFYRLTVYDNSTIMKVANRIVRIQLDTVGYDLAMRDSYLDMLDEPNSQATVDPHEWQIWQSPDLWNRYRSDDSTNNQDAQFFSGGASNYAYARVRNVGCISSPAGHHLKLYWTKASTGEKWSMDWTSGNIGGIASGREITPTGGLTIPVLQPGHDTLLNYGWNPEDPTQYPGNPESVDLCLLARIEDTSAAPFGMHSTEVQRTTTNVLNNNNVVTRNMMLVNLGNAQPKIKSHQIIFANTESSNQTFSLQLINNKDIKKHFAGDLSDYITATLHLGDLYDKWQTGGGLGVFGVVDAENKTVSYDPSTPLRLDNISLDADESYIVTVDFTLRDGVSIPFDVTGQEVHVRQLIAGSGGDEIYGNVSFDINFAQDSISDDKFTRRTSSIINKTAYYLVFPNPVSNMLNVSFSGEDNTTADIFISDVTGRVVVKKRMKMQNGLNTGINTSSLVPGLYYVRINDNHSNIETYKLIKIK